MLSSAFSVLFVVFFLSTLALRYWLARRQIRHVLAHRAQVPADFAAKVTLPAHQKGADYTVAKTRFGLFHALFDGLVLMGFTLLGGLQALSTALLPVAGPGVVHGMLLLVAYAAIAGLLELPFGYYFNFVLEQRFGFNKMSVGLWVKDGLLHLGIGAVLGLPLLWAVLTLMERSGALWWVYTWVVWSAFQLLVMVIYPIWIAPLFNKFTPVEDVTLKSRIDGLLARVDFAAKGLFVMDGSKRSAHGNALFSGFGKNKRIVFFDTLIDKLAPQEVEAVLAHELGHFKLKHIVKRILVAFALSFAFLALLGWLKEQAWFYGGLGVRPMLGRPNDAMALLLFMLALPVFTFPFAPLASLSSRRHEFEADAFAAKHSDARDLVSALVKMYDDNASTLTPDPLHSAFYDSHPKPWVRVQRLQAAGLV